MTDCVKEQLHHLFDDMNRKGVVDIRKPPDRRRKGQFLQGWKDSLAGTTRGGKSLEKLTWNNLGWRAAEATKVCTDVDPKQVYDYLAGDGRTGGLQLDVAGWEPRSTEDHLLQRYWEVHGGEIHVEAPVGVDHGPWDGRGSVRRLDGLRISMRPAEIYLPSDQRIQESLHSSGSPPIEVIEVKKKLNRTVIGQTQAGRLLLLARYNLNPADVREVVVCANGDAALEWVCCELGIRVWIPND